MVLKFDYKKKWDLEKFYSSLNDEKLNKDIGSIMSIIDTFAKKYKGKIKDFDSTSFLNFFDEKNAISEKIQVPMYFLHLSNSLDTQNQEIIKKMGDLGNLFTKVSNKLLFISQEFKEIGYEKLMKFSKDPVLKDYSNYFYQSAISIKYLLDEKTEFALNLKKNSGRSAFVELYEELTNSFMFEIEIDGKIKSVTDSEIRTLRTSPDEKVRKKAYESMKKVYFDKKVQIVLGNCYGSVVRDWISEIEMRKYDNNVMTQRNLGEELNAEVVDMLLLEVEKAYPIYQKYLKLKTKNLGYEKLDIWNVYAPLSKVEKEYKFEDAFELYLNVVKEFDSELYEYSKDMFIEGRVDVFPKEGKRGGAFALFTSKFPSFVLLNHTNKMRDVSILAHELGHAFHGHIRQSQKSQVYGPGLSLEETASIFNETMLNESLTKNMKDSEKLEFLDDKLGDIFATIFRQVQYVLFERRVHSVFFEKKELTYVDFNEMWREEQVKLFGDAVEFDTPSSEEFGWSSIPHIFHSPFYCYAYSFGNILSFSLYNMYKEEGKAFVPKYKEILRSGGSKSPAELLLDYGIDITKPEFFRGGIKVVSDMVDEYEKLSKNREI